MNTDKETCDDCDRIAVYVFTRIDGEKVRLCKIHHDKRSFWGY